MGLLSCIPMSDHAGRISLVLLLLALSTMFVSGNDRGFFYQPESEHSKVAANHLAVAANLSPEHGFIGFYRQYLNGDGERAYEAYNRFPLAVRGRSPRFSDGWLKGPAAR